MSPHRPRASSDGRVPSGAKDPIRDFAFVADGNRGALIGPNGDISWMCFTGWPDPAAFAKLLDSKGIFDIYPIDQFVTGGHYEESSLIWHSRWVTHHAILESRDALAYPSTPERAICFGAFPRLRSAARW